jgi:hypothetical protein
LPYSGFQLLTGEGIIAGFGIYENQLYFYGKPVPNVDLESFITNIQLGSISYDHIVKDKNAVYYIGLPKRYDMQIITGADSRTFTGIIYHYDYPDGTSYDDTLWDYYQDKKRVYRKNLPMPNVDKATFQPLGKSYIYGHADYSKDKLHVYANASVVT